MLLSDLFYSFLNAGGFVHRNRLWHAKGEISVSRLASVALFYAESRSRIKNTWDKKIYIKINKSWLLAQCSRCIDFLRILNLTWDLYSWRRRKKIEFTLREITRINLSAKNQLLKVKKKFCETVELTLKITHTFLSEISFCTKNNSITFYVNSILCQLF